ncbi:MAG TPA: hypothetical protein VGG99_19865 [Acetobacteraceae bacterium]
MTPPRTARPAGSSVLTGGAGTVIFYSGGSEAAPTIAGALTNAPSGSVAAGMLILTGSSDPDTARTSFLFGARNDSVSVGGVSSTLAVAGMPDRFEPPGELRIDMNMLNLAGADSTAPATDGAATMHLPGGTRIDMVGAAYVVRSPFA